LATP
jgi:hypothetical protein